jgi:TPR repeat protein/uncharacterized caspase-like protein
MSGYITKSMIFGLASLLAACANGPSSNEGNEQQDADKLLIIDCLLPGQVRKLGSQFTYQTQRRPIKTTASECEIRGGEYVAFDRADFATSLRVWSPLAAEGDAEAQNYLGQIYEKGLGLAPDFKTAAIWYKRSAEQGYSAAQINLGHLYEKGLGVPRDPIVALNWYRRASGISDDSLQYASSVEVAKTSQKELEQLQQQVVVQQQQASQFKAELDGVRGQLAAKEAALQLAKKERERKQQQVLSFQESGNEKGLETVKRELASYDQRLGLQESEFLTLENSAKGLEQQLASVNQDHSSFGPLPVIEIIDPPMSITRGVRSASLKPDVSEVEVVGKVEAPAGLSKFEINGRSYKPDEYSLFWVDLPISESVTPVHIKATDKNGRKVAFDFSLYSDKSRLSSTPFASELVSAEGVKLGSYYALVIGNDQYANLPDLKTPANDARATAKILKSKYGFETKLLLNASRYDILYALNELREKLSETDNLLIYYAGHGELDTVNNRGYWLPVDADKHVNANWISNVAITDIVNAMKAKHVMVVADSCYSGTMSGTSLSRASVSLPLEMQKEWIEAMAEVKARTVLTSGGVQPVLDLGGGEHSIFAQAFLAALENNKGLLEGHALYLDVLKQIRVPLARVNQEQTPQYAPIQHAGHEAGEFLLQAI